MLSDIVRFKVDFNNRRHDRVVASFRYASSARIPDIGDTVELYDDEGNGCEGTIARVAGRIVEVAPDWRTWRTTDVPREAGFRSGWDADSGQTALTTGGITSEPVPG
jgi:hypothetical protein